ncbi:MAG: hypothetical protein ACQEW8_10750 [Actinomycetota bacterium]
MTMTEELWNANEAEEIVHLFKDVTTGEPLFVSVLDDVEGTYTHEMDKHLAHAVAARLVKLANELPEPPRILRRHRDVDDQLRGIEL